MRSDRCAARAARRCCESGANISNAAFATMLDQGGLRRATLRGCEKLTKRHMVAAMTYNLSLLMRSLFGIGTPKQAMAASQARLIAACRWLSRLVSGLFSR